MTYQSPTSSGRQLLVLGCSQKKRDSQGSLPAIERYNGSTYQTLRNFLRSYQWPENVSIAVLSAEHGLFGGLKGIENYDTRMTPEIAAARAPECCALLNKWASSHERMFLSLGKDYLPAVQDAVDSLENRAKIFRGPIGMKNHQVKEFLESSGAAPRTKAEVASGNGRMSYFLPDWDDLLDPNFDFEKDEFSGNSRKERQDKHCCVLIKPKRMCDGILVSLAQHTTSKGPLRRLEGSEDGALFPTPMREQFGLSKDQWLFGDCGAFSYVNNPLPTITVEQAVAMYELYGFDFGASVDHIPVTSIVLNGKKEPLSLIERQERVRMTHANAEIFFDLAKKRKSRFNPVGIVQALSPEDYGEAVKKYYDIGYRHLAIGGLVPLSDSGIEEIVKSIYSATCKLKTRPWIHLFGVFRPKLQKLFQECKIDSFDSATYFRKAWLRSDQNYLADNGKWYAAIRVPMTSDGRTRKKLENADVDIAKLEQEEKEVLRLLCLYNRHEANVNEVLNAVVDYDRHLTRTSDSHSMKERYRQTLVDRPWEDCDCRFCKENGIHIAIFRGANRNKRRGAHNTLRLYGQINQSEVI